MYGAWAADRSGYYHRGMNERICPEISLGNLSQPVWKGKMGRVRRMRWKPPRKAVCLTRRCNTMLQSEITGRRHGRRRIRNFARWKKQSVCYTHFHSNKVFRGDLKENNPDIINPINQSGGTDEMEYIIRISALSSVTFPARGLLRSLWKCSTAADLRLRQPANFRRFQTAVRRKLRRISIVILKGNSQ